MLKFNFRKGWYVLYTKPKHEKKVNLAFQEMGIASYLPMFKELRTWKDRKRYIEMPLFPSYIFVYLNNVQEYFKSLDNYGVFYFLRIGKEIARINDEVIIQIHKIVESCVDLEISTHKFVPGRNLVITDGVFSGLNCEIVKYNGRDRILVRINLLERNLLVSLNHELIV